MYNKPLNSLNDIIIFSHLRWEFVTQRPQHIARRLSEGRKILYIEEPIGYSTSSDFGTANVIREDNITVIQPKISWENCIEELVPIVNEYTQKLTLNDPIFWFYSPFFVDVTSYLDSSLIVYDCMDELKAFKGAPKSLIDQEKILLDMADVVFTGGKSLYDSKKKHTSNAHCFPSSVDRKHFEKALGSSEGLPVDIVNLDKPVIGFYGVIDERIDLSLLEKTASLKPEVSFVMIGPIAKIEEKDLPKAKNIHYLGSKSYQELPAYLKGIDIAMMPFAINEATEFISPTKTLEFMAAQKPIISTPIYDVVRDYEKEVSIVSNAKEFALTIDKYLKESVMDKKLRIEQESKAVARTSWDRTVEKMNQIINGAIDSETKDARRYALLNSL